jgi:putative ABC transport system permease protein
MIFANIRSALEQLVAHRMRSLLTVLAIVIAVTSTIVVVSIVQGFTTYVSDIIEGQGTNAMFIFPERPPGDAGALLGRVEMDERDSNAIAAECPALLRVSPLVPQQAPLMFEGTEISVSIEGCSPDYHVIRNFPIDAGRELAHVDVRHAHQVCIVGREVLRLLDIDEDLIGKSVFLAGRRFRVIGVLQSKGSFFGQSLDNTVLIPYTSALRINPQFRRRLIVTAQTTSAKAVPEAKAQVSNLLRRRHRLRPLQPNDFNIQTQDEFLEMFNNMSRVATSVLTGIVGVSLLVGGIGVMNVMLVSVTERTREIGLRKAVGARRRDILMQFLTEATVLSIVGGGLGIALGFGLSSLASLHPLMIDVIVPFWVVALGVGISAGTGVIFGLLPALKAALLNPIDALRHE